MPWSILRRCGYLKDLVRKSSSGRDTRTYHRLRGRGFTSDSCMERNSRPQRDRSRLLPLVSQLTIKDVPLVSLNQRCSISPLPTSAYLERYTPDSSLFYLSKLGTLSFYSKQHEPRVEGRDAMTLCGPIASPMAALHRIVPNYIGTIRRRTCAAFGSNYGPMPTLRTSGRSRISPDQLPLRACFGC